MSRCFSLFYYYANNNNPKTQQLSQQSSADDIDFNEIFAEYFINEFDDPLNAYTNSMANYYSGGTVTLPPEAAATTAAPSMEAQAPVSLPTGGIRTAFHTGAAAATVQKSDAVVAPAAKKPRSEAQPLAAPPTTLVPPQQQGVLLAAQQLQQNHAVAAAAAAAQQHHHPGAVVNTTTAAVAGSGGVALPVGVGIRLGGVGGIAPAMAQQQQTTSAGGMMVGGGGQYTATMWGGVNAGVVSDQVAAERRQRNREHAKRSRVRKKFMLESLQEQVLELQRENQRLRMITQEHIPEHAMKIIAECCTSNPLFDDTDHPHVESSTGGKEEPLVRSDFSLMKSLASGQKCFVLSDPKLPDNPIVFASADFYKLTGYSSKEVLGRNCRFLQGPGTDSKAVDVIRKAISTGSDCTVCLLNYRADGKPFWNQFFLAALRDSDNCIVNYVSTSFLSSKSTFFGAGKAPTCVFPLFCLWFRWVCKLKSNHDSRDQRPSKTKLTPCCLYRTRMIRSDDRASTCYQ